MKRKQTAAWRLVITSVLSAALAVTLFGCGYEPVEDTPTDQLNGLSVGNAVTIHGVTVSVDSIAEGEPALNKPTYEVTVTYVNNSGRLVSISPYDWGTVRANGSDMAHVGGSASFNLTNLTNGQTWTGVVTLWAYDDAESVRFESSSLNLAKDKKKATWVINI